MKYRRKILLMTFVFNVTKRFLGIKTFRIYSTFNVTKEDVGISLNSLKLRVFSMLLRRLSRYFCFQ